MEKPQDILTGTVIGDESVLSINELARACGAESQWIDLIAVVERNLSSCNGLGLAIGACPPV